MQDVVIPNLVIDCPRNKVGLVIGKQGETIKALRRAYGVSIDIDQNPDPMKVTVAGQALAVDSAADAVRELINGGWPNLGTSRIERPCAGGPEGPGSIKLLPPLMSRDHDLHDDRLRIIFMVCETLP